MNVKRRNPREVANGTAGQVEIFQSRVDNVLYYKNTKGELVRVTDESSSVVSDATISGAGTAASPLSVAGTNLSVFNNDSGFITAETDTLATVMGRGASTTISVNFGTSNVGSVWNTQNGNTFGVTKNSQGAYDGMLIQNHDGLISLESFDLTPSGVAATLWYDMNAVTGYHIWDQGNMQLGDGLTNAPVLELPNTTTGQIDSATVKATITKEWFNANVPKSLYNDNDTVGAGRTATLTDTLTFQRTTASTTAEVIASNTATSGVGQFTATGVGASAYLRGSAGAEVGSVAGNFTVAAANNISYTISGGTLAGTTRTDGNWVFGTGTGTATGRVQIQGAGTTSATFGLVVEKSSGADVLTARDDGFVGVNGATKTGTEFFAVTGETRISSGIGLLGASSSSNAGVRVPDNTVAIAFGDSGGSSFYETGGNLKIVAQNSTTNSIDFLHAGFQRASLKEVSFQSIFEIMHRGSAAGVPTRESLIEIISGGYDTDLTGNVDKTVKIINQTTSGTDVTHSLDIEMSGTVQFIVKDTGVINMPNLPTSSVGLVAGDLWNDSGTLKIV